jgi:N-acetylglucosamine transport system permease protein
VSTLSTDRRQASSPRARSILRSLVQGTRGAVPQAVLSAWTVLVLFPFVWIAISAFKSDREIFFSPWALPATLRWENFVKAWEEASIGLYFWNSLIVVLGALVLTLIVSSMAAYVLARYEFPGNRIIQYGFLVGMMFPVFLALVPLFFLLRDLHLLASYQGLILVYTAYALPFSIFFLTAFFRTLPTEIGEAAVVDGASDFGVFWHVMLPMAQPGLVTVGIFNFLGMWNQFILPIVLNPDPERYVLPQGLAFLAVEKGYQADWAVLIAGLTISVIPTLVAYVIFQRRLERGLTVGALKG